MIAFGFIELGNPENIGFGVETAFQTGLQAEIYKYFRFGGRHVGFPTSSLVVERSPSRSLDSLTHENNAAGILV